MAAIQAGLESQLVSIFDEVNKRNWTNSLFQDKQLLQ